MAKKKHLRTQMGSKNMGAFLKVFFFFVVSKDHPKRD